MTGMTKRLRIAVVGERASGKSYLLYDLIHAFGLLGYAPEQLPLSFPHSSFGTYFYDTFNSENGGMKGTENYACRPDNHYAAWLSKGRIGRRLEVDFLNIPGEVFNMKNDILGKFFTLTKVIERKKKGLFYLSVWRNPAGKETRLIVFDGLDLANGDMSRPSNRFRFGNYIYWDNLRNDLFEGQYREVKRQPVSGHYLLSHLTELQTDSVLLTLEHCWDYLSSLEEMSFPDYKGNKVLFYFYPLVYCQQATDLIICDNLIHGNNVGKLAERVADFMREGNRRPHSYLAFRGIDKVLDNFQGGKGALLSQSMNTDASTRNKIYEWMMGDVEKQIFKKDQDDVAVQPEDRVPHIQQSLGDVAVLPEDWVLHIQQSFGDETGQAFWHLLNASMDEGLFAKWRARITNKMSAYMLLRKLENCLPPHTYFTATPIDARLRVYKNDPDVVTRFLREEDGLVRAFTTEVNSGREQHLCLGSYQLLTDILLQNGISSEGLRQRGEHLQFMQSKL